MPNEMTTNAPSLKSSLKSSPTQDWTADGTKHRLVCPSTGKATQWANYRECTFLNGYVGFTAYWLHAEGVLAAEEFCKQAFVGLD